MTLPRFTPSPRLPLNIAVAYQYQRQQSETQSARTLDDLRFTDLMALTRRTFDINRMSRVSNSMIERIISTIRTSKVGSQELVCLCQEMLTGATNHIERLASCLRQETPRTWHSYRKTNLRAQRTRMDYLPYQSLLSYHHQRPTSENLPSMIIVAHSYHPRLIHWRGRSLYCCPT